MTTRSHLHVLRQGTGPAVLLLHGIGASGTAWTRQMEQLAGEFACMAPDLPGYGDSPDPIAPGFESFVDEVAGVLDDQPAHVVGVSFGALCAIGLARRHPALVTSLVLADATLGRAARPAAELDRWLQHRQRLSGELATRSLERAAEIAAPDAPPEVLQEIAAHMRRARATGYMAVANAIAQTDARPWLANIGAPALVICGEHDTVTGPDVSKDLAAGLPSATLLTLKSSGHAPHIEQPEPFAQAVRRFLHGLGGVAGTGRKTT